MGRLVNTERLAVNFPTKWRPLFSVICLILVVVLFSALTVHILPNTHATSLRSKVLNLYYVDNNQDNFQPYNDGYQLQPTLMSSNTPGSLINEQLYQTYQSGAAQMSMLAPLPNYPDATFGAQTQIQPNYQNPPPLSISDNIQYNSNFGQQNDFQMDSRHPNYNEGAAVAPGSGGVIPPNALHSQTAEQEAYHKIHPRKEIDTVPSTAVQTWPENPQPTPISEKNQYSSNFGQQPYSQTDGNRPSSYEPGVGAPVLGGALAQNSQYPNSYAQAYSQPPPSPENQYSLYIAQKSYFEMDDPVPIYNDPGAGMAGHGKIVQDSPNLGQQTYFQVDESQPFHNFLASTMSGQDQYDQQSYKQADKLTHVDNVLVGSVGLYEMDTLNGDSPPARGKNPLFNQFFSFKGDELGQPMPISKPAALIQGDLVQTMPISQPAALILGDAYGIPKFEGPSGSVVQPMPISHPAALIQEDFVQPMPISQPAALIQGDAYSAAPKFDGGSMAQSQSTYQNQALTSQEIRLGAKESSNTYDTFRYEQNPNINNQQVTSTSALSQYGTQNTGMGYVKENFGVAPLPTLVSGPQSTTQVQPYQNTAFVGSSVSYRDDEAAMKAFSHGQNFDNDPYQPYYLQPATWNNLEQDPNQQYWAQQFEWSNPQTPPPDNSPPVDNAAFYRPSGDYYPQEIFPQTLDGTLSSFSNGIGGYDQQTYSTSLASAPQDYPQEQYQTWSSGLTPMQPSYSEQNFVQANNEVLNQVQTQPQMLRSSVPADGLPHPTLAGPSDQQVFNGRADTRSDYPNEPATVGTPPWKFGPVTLPKANSIFKAYP